MKHVHALRAHQRCQSEDTRGIVQLDTPEAEEGHVRRVELSHDRAVGDGDNATDRQVEASRGVESGHRRLELLDTTLAKRLHDLQDPERAGTHERGTFHSRHAMPILWSGHAIRRPRRLAWEVSLPAGCRVGWCDESPS